MSKNLQVPYSARWSGEKWNNHSPSHGGRPAGGFFHVLNCRLTSGFFQESGPVPHLDNPLKHKEFFMLEVKNLTFRVTDGGEATILDNLSFTVLQLYRGVVIKISGHGDKKRFTVRKMSGTIGVERIFPIESPAIDSIEVNKVGKVRRAKLYYLRALTGKKARIKEKRVNG